MTYLGHEQKDLLLKQIEQLPGCLDKYPYLDTITNFISN